MGLGCFINEKDAALAYDNKLRELKGKKGKYNFPKKGEKVKNIQHNFYIYFYKNHTHGNETNSFEWGNINYILPENPTFFFYTRIISCQKYSTKLIRMLCNTHHNSWKRITLFLCCNCAVYFF